MTAALRGRGVLVSAGVFAQGGASAGGQPARAPARRDAVSGRCARSRSAPMRREERRFLRGQIVAADNGIADSTRASARGVARRA